MTADQAWLETFVAEQGGVAGTVHRADGPDLSLSAALNIPPPVLAAVTHVPRGKGMAGLAQVRGRAVQTCNLQQDASGDINPMAKLVGGQAAIALPLVRADGSVRAVVGIAFATDGDIDEPTERRLNDAAATLAEDPAGDQAGGGSGGR